MVASTEEPFWRGKTFAPVPCIRSPLPLPAPPCMYKLSPPSVPSSPIALPASLTPRTAPAPDPLLTIRAVPSLCEIWDESPTWKACPLPVLKAGVVDVVPMCTIPVELIRIFSE